MPDDFFFLEQLKLRNTKKWSQNAQNKKKFKKICKLKELQSKLITDWFVADFKLFIFDWWSNVNSWLGNLLYGI